MEIEFVEQEPADLPRDEIAPQPVSGPLFGTPQDLARRRAARGDGASRV